LHKSFLCANISEESVKALIKEFLSNESRNVEKGVILNFLNNINEFLIKEIKVKSLLIRGDKFSIFEYPFTISL
jgi:hypothetical protein